ncbi:helix-turn-helix transcriptional regulator [soil metagenome]
MNQVTTFTTPGGEEMVVLPREDFDRLVAAAEDHADIATYDQAKARLATGEDELVPAAVVDRILQGESPIRVWRQHRGLTMSDLADTTSLSQAYLSQIETGKRVGQAETLRVIATALGVTIDDLI